MSGITFIVKGNVYKSFLKLERIFLNTYRQQINFTAINYNDVIRVIAITNVKVC